MPKLYEIFLLMVQALSYMVLGFSLLAIIILAKTKNLTLFWISITGLILFYILQTINLILENYNGI
jgi:hypothetical protein